MKATIEKSETITTLTLNEVDVLTIWLATKELLSMSISSTQRSSIAKLHFALDDSNTFIIDGNKRHLEVSESNNE